MHSQTSNQRVLALRESKRVELSMSAIYHCNMSRKIEATKLDTELMLAARNGDREMVSKLIENGVDVDEVDDDGRTAFLHASISAQTDTAKILLNAGANINAIDHTGSSATHYLCSCRSTTRSQRFFRQLMLKRRADMQVINKAGLSPLMITAKSGYFVYSQTGRPALAQILIEEAKVDVNLRNAVGHSALQYAIADDNEEIAMMLIKAGAGPRNPSNFDWEITLNAAKTNAIKAKYAAMLQHESLLNFSMA